MRARLALASAALMIPLVLTACGGAPSGPSSGPGTTGAGTQAPSSASSGSASASSTTGSGAGAHGGPSQDPAVIATWLTTTDVEKISGISGIKTIPRDAAKGAGGDLNFATSDGKLVLIANFSDAATFDASKSGKNYAQSLTGIGDDGYVGPSTSVSPTMYLVALKKGNNAAILTTFFKSPGQTYLSVSQLVELGIVVSSRW